MHAVFYQIFDAQTTGHDFETLDRAKGLPDCGCCAFRLPDGLLDVSLS